MSLESRQWARRQYGWGIAFAVALLLVLFWSLLVPGSNWLRLGTGESALPPFATPQADATSQAALAAAEATLDAAAQNPIGSMDDVMAAAQTVVAVTVTPQAGFVSPVPPEGETGDDTPGSASEGTPAWLASLVANIPALTALVTFVGLVFTSLMKWRADLHETGRQRRALELQQHELQRDRHEYELERMRSAFELERQKLDYELARKKLELRALEERVAELQQQTAAMERRLRDSG